MADKPSFEEVAKQAQSYPYPKRSFPSYPVPYYRKKPGYSYPYAYPRPQTKKVGDYTYPYYPKSPYKYPRRYPSPYPYKTNSSSYPHPATPEGKNLCQCKDCSYIIKTEKDCDESKCPKCGGDMTAVKKTHDSDVAFPPSVLKPVKEICSEFGSDKCPVPSDFDFEGYGIPNEVSECEHREDYSCPFLAEDFELQPLFEEYEVQDAKHVEIFKAGQWKGKDYTEAELDKMVENFNELTENTEFAVPLKLGHDADNLKGLPALGWVTNLSKSDGSLFADFTQIPKKVHELLEKGAYRKPSVELDLIPLFDSYEEDDKEYDIVLSAVALLGSDIPEIRSLQDILSLGEEVEVEDSNGPILLAEETSENGPWYGLAPLLKINKLTRKKTRYSKHCADKLVKDVKKLIRDNDRIIQMDMTHSPSKQPDYNAIEAMRAKVVDIYPPDAHDIVRVKFAIPDTERGRDTRNLIRDDFIKGVSLRSSALKFSRSFKNGERILDVNEMKVPYGIDFTNNRSMLFDEEDDYQIKLLEELLKEDTKQMGKENKEKEEVEETQETEEIEEEEKDTETPSEDELDLKEEKLTEREKRLEIVEEKIDQRERDAEIRLLKDDVKQQVTQLLEEKCPEEFTDTAKSKVKARTQKQLFAEIDLMEEVPEAIEEGAILEALEPQIEDFSSVIADLESKKMRDSENKLDSSNAWANFATVPSDESRAAELEEATGSRDPAVIMASKALRQPLVIDGKPVYNVPLLEELRDAQNQFSRGSFPKLEEAGEMTSAETVANLPAELADAVLIAAVPDLIAGKISRTGKMTRKDKTIYEEKYRRVAVHEFGRFEDDDSAIDTGADEGAITYPKRMFAQVDGSFSATSDLTFTVTYTDQNGITGKSGTVTVPQTASDGDRYMISPASVGELATDITAVSDESTDFDAGRVLFGVEQALASSEASAYPKSRVYLEPTTLSASSMELGGDISHDMLEDVRNAVAQEEYDAAEAFVRLLTRDFRESVDQRIIIDAVDQADNSMTWTQSSPPAGYTQEEWNAKFTREVDRLVEKIKFESKVKPNWLLINPTDKSDYKDWSKDELFKAGTDRGNAYQNARKVGKISGCDVYESEAMPKSKVMAGSNENGMHYYVFVPLQLFGPVWNPSNNTMAIMRRQRSARKITRAKTLGTLLIN